MPLPEHLVDRYLKDAKLLPPEDEKYNKAHDATGRFASSGGGGGSTGGGIPAGGLSSADYRSGMADMFARQKADETQFAKTGKSDLVKGRPAWVKMDDTYKSNVAKAGVTLDSAMGRGLTLTAGGKPLQKGSIKPLAWMVMSQSRLSKTGAAMSHVGGGESMINLSKALGASERHLSSGATTGSAEVGA